MDDLFEIKKMLDVAALIQEIRNEVGNNRRASVTNGSLSGIKEEVAVFCSDRDGIMKLISSSVSNVTIKIIDKETLGITRRSNNGC